MKEKEEIIKFLIMTGEISADMVREIIPEDKKRYKIINELKQAGLYRISEDGMMGYRIKIREARESRSIKKMIENQEKETGEEIHRAKKDAQSRAIMQNRNEVYRQIYKSEIEYMPARKPRIGEKFPYTGSIQFLNREEIGKAVREKPLYYNITEIKRKKEGEGIQKDDVMERNRSAGILIGEGEIFNVYSFVTAKSLNLKWQRKSDEPIYGLMRGIGGGKEISTIYIGRDMSIAKEFLEKSTGEKTARKSYGVTIDNCGRGELYFIPRYATKEKGSTRLIEYLADTKYRKRMDDTILEYMQAERRDSKYILGMAGGRYIINLMDFNLKKLRNALQVIKPVIFCFDWQEDFIKEQFKNAGKDVELYAYSEADILSSR